MPDTWKEKLADGAIRMMTRHPIIATLLATVVAFFLAAYHRPGLVDYTFGLFKNDPSGYVLVILFGMIAFMVSLRLQLGEAKALASHAATQVDTCETERNELLVKCATADARATAAESQATLAADSARSAFSTVEHMFERLREIDERKKGAGQAVERERRGARPSDGDGDDECRR